MRTLTEKEIESVKQLREIVRDLCLDEEKNSDDFLVRWLRARDQNLKKAEEMLRNSMKWRKENKIDSILEWEPPDIYNKMMPTAICGFNSDGIPVAVMPSRFIDIDHFWELDQDEYIRYSVRVLEVLIDENRKRSKTGYSTYEFIGIYDIYGLNIRSLLNRRYMNLVKNSTKTFDENYPEILRKAYFVYTPSIFPLLFAMCKPFIPKRTVGKFEFCGSDIQKMRQTMSKEIPLECLPPRYGGLNEEFDRTAFNNCGKKFFSRKVSVNGEIETDGFIESYVPAGQSIDFTFDIDDPGTVIHWCFKTENYDIGFSITYCKDTNELPEIIHSFQRVDSQFTKQIGSTICQTSGKYALLFNNNYSRLRSKKLFLKVDLCNPKTTSDVNKTTR